MLEMKGHMMSTVLYGPNEVYLNKGKDLLKKYMTIFNYYSHYLTQILKRLIKKKHSFSSYMVVGKLHSHSCPGIHWQICGCQSQLFYCHKEIHTRQDQAFSNSYFSNYITSANKDYNGGVLQPIL